MPWVINLADEVYYWNGVDFNQVPGCAISIAVGPTSAPFAGISGDTWAVGCGGGIFQLENGAEWVQIPGPIASQISVSPDLGVPWVVNPSGQIFQ